MIIEWQQFLKDGLQLGQKKASVTVGVFDGVHRGHRALIEKVVSRGGHVPVAFTFNSGSIQTIQEKTQMLCLLGLEILVVIDFNETFKQIPGNEFLEILLKHMDIGFFAVGSDFRCGYRQDTDAAAIAKFFADRGIHAEIVPEVMEGGLPISSSRIRTAIGTGDFSAAESMLGRKITVA